MRALLKLVFVLAVVASGLLAIRQTLRSRDGGATNSWKVFVRLPGGEVQGRSKRPGEYRLPCIHPDGQSVVFQGGAPGEHNRVWRADIETGEMKALTSPEANAWMPVYARDGSRIAFTSDLNSADRAANVAASVPWFPDRSTHLYTADPEGGGLKQITFGPHRDIRPSFSPDGESIAFISDRINNTERIWIVSLTEGAEPRLVDGAYHAAMRPWYAHDGKRLFFQTGVAERKNRIASIPIEGGEILTLERDDRGLTRGAFTIPGQDALLVHSTRGGNWSLWRFPLDDSPPQQILLAGFEAAFHGTQALNGTLAFDSPMRTDG